MKILKALMLISLSLTSAIVLWSWKKFEKPAMPYRSPAMPMVSMCGSFPWALNDTLPLPQARIIEGLGNLHYPITTTSLKAQEFFEQGLRLVYAFNHWEAIQAFRTASQLDPVCALA
jgi:hypothetical protein